MERRVVVTGIGVVSPLGNKSQLWENLLKGVSGIGKVTHFDASEYPVRIAAEVKDFNPTEYLEPKEMRRMDLFCQYAVCAAVQSLSDAGLTITDANAHRVGVLIGSGIGGVSTIEKQTQILREKGVDKVSPFWCRC